MTRSASPSTERIMTLHPAGKRGVNIEKVKYDEMRRVLLKAIPKTRTGTAFSGLRDRVEPLLNRAKFPAEASTTWYLVTVKQDLEARGLIEQIEGVRPQHVRRI